MGAENSVAGAPSPARPGRFVTLEGIEGSGKSLQLRLLEEELRRRQVRFLSTFEPGGTPLGRELRRILVEKEGAPREPQAELLLYLADRCQHLAEVIEPALAVDTLVLCDRYLDATLAYQGHARGIGFEPIDRLAEILSLRRPDLTLLFDVAVETGMGRARRRGEEDRGASWGRFEAEAVEFHLRVREGYLLLARREPRRIRVVDSEGTPEEVSRRVRQILEEVGVLGGVAP